MPPGPRGSASSRSPRAKSIGGGGENIAGSNDGDPTNHYYATVGGGKLNTAGAAYAAVGGGKSNVAAGNYAAVAGGLSNTAGGHYSTVPGGRSNFELA